MFDAYFDIETTGLSCLNADITVVGVYLDNGTEIRVSQLIARQITRRNLLEAFHNVRTIYTYNGTRFDLPFIYSLLGIDLRSVFNHHDLMYDCWRHNLKGGLKAVEQQLGITRQLKGINGWDAVKLWSKYQNYGDLDALALLLRYNKEDVMNLKALKEKLETRDF